jgi:hypothetical protein
MKKFILLLIVGLLASCATSVIVEEEIPQEEVIEVDVVVPEVVEVLPEAQEDNNFENPEVEESNTEAEVEQPLIANIKRVDVDDYWQQVIREYSSYFDFRYQGCVSQISLEIMECRKYDWQFRNVAYYHNILYFQDGQEVLLRQLASDAMKRDQEFLQVIFVGELLGFIPASQRNLIEQVTMTDQAGIVFQEGVLRLPDQKDIEYNISFLKDLYDRFIGSQVNALVQYSELEDVLDEPISEYATLGSDATKVSETYLAYYFQTIAQAELRFFEASTYDELDRIFTEKGLQASLNASDEQLNLDSLPAHAVLYVNSELEKTLPPSSPSALDAIEYIGITEQAMKDRRNIVDHVNNQMYPYRTYEIRYIDDDSMMMYVNADIAQADADAIVEEVSQIYGQLPVFLRRPLNFVTVQPGTPNISLYPDGYVFHLGYYRMPGRPMHHFLIHEIAHISLDWAQGLNFPDSGGKNIYYKLDQSPLVESEWLDAYEKDGEFITQYAFDYPFPVSDNQFGYRGGEDVADTLVFYMASRLNREQYHPKLLALWETVLGNRFAILDQLDFSLPQRGRLSP